MISFMFFNFNVSFFLCCIAMLHPYLNIFFNLETFMLHLLFGLFHFLSFIAHSTTPTVKSTHKTLCETDIFIYFSSIVTFGVTSFPCNSTTTRPLSFAITFVFSSTTHRKCHVSSHVVYISMSTLNNAMFFSCRLSDLAFGLLTFPHFLMQATSFNILYASL